MSADPFAASPLNDEVILTEDAVAAFRLPIPLDRFSAITSEYRDAGVTCTQRGDFFVLLRPNPDDEL